MRARGGHGRAAMTEYTALLGVHMDPGHLQQGGILHPDDPQLHAHGLAEDPSQQHLDQDHQQVHHFMGQHDELKAAESGGGEGPAPQQCEPERPAAKTCSKCKATKACCEFFRDKSKPDGLYSQCKTCAAAEERRRLEERAAAAPAPEAAKAEKRCTRCGIDKPVSAFCRNKRSSDGLYSQCRTCVSEKDKDRRNRIQVNNEWQQATHKVCSRCHADKSADEFYKDSSKPDGLQTYCKPCLCAKHKDARDRRRLRGIEEHMQHASAVAAVANAYQAYGSAAGLQAVAANAAPLLGSFSDSLAQGFALQGQREQQHYELHQGAYAVQQGEDQPYAQGMAGAEQYQLPQHPEEGYLTQHEGEQRGFQEHEQGSGAFAQPSGAEQGYAHPSASEGYHHHHLVPAQSYEQPAEVFQGRPLENGAAQQEHEEMHVIDFGADPGPESDVYQEQQPTVKRARRSRRPGF